MTFEEQLEELVKLIPEPYRLLMAVHYPDRVGPFGAELSYTHSVMLGEKSVMDDPNASFTTIWAATPRGKGDSLREALADALAQVETRH